MMIPIKDFLLRKDLPINIGIVLVSFILIINMYTRHNRQYKDLKHQIDNNRQINQLLKELKSIENKVLNIRKNFWEYSASVSNVVAEELNKKLRELKAKDTIVTAIKEEDKKHYMVLSFRTTFTLAYKEVLQFLQYIDNYPKIFEIQSVNIKRAYDKLEEDSLGVELLLQVYSLKK